MMKKNKLVCAAAFALCAVLWAGLIAPFFLGAPAAHPATDDFTFAAYTHATWEQTHSIPHVLKDALSYALRTWRDWQGTITGVIVMTLNPAVFSLEHYGVHAVALLALHLVSWFVFLDHVLRRRLGLPRGLSLALYGALSCCSLAFLPDIVEGIYWFNGAWFYTGAQAAALITLVLCDCLAQSRAGRAAKISFAALCLYILGMKYLGFIICTPILVYGITTYFAKASGAQTKLWARIVFAVAVTAIVWITYVPLFGMDLPAGLLFE